MIRLSCKYLRVKVFENLSSLHVMRQYQNYSIRYENTMLCNRDLQKTAVTLVP